MTGCTNYCSYCIVPYVRGEERSREAADIITEVEQLVSDGVVEVTLLGQNVNAYGLDLSSNSKKETFPALLEQLDGIDGLERIRFMTSNPKDLSDDLLGAMRDLDSVCEHLHLPVQSGATRVLDLMERGYSREHYLELVEKLYEKVPGAALTTDIIVGFPGEKEDDFYRTMTLVDACRFDGAFTFVYSRREGTRAAEMPGQLPAITRTRRVGELVELIQGIAREKNEALVGETVEVLVDGESRQGGGQLRGRTRGSKIVNFTNNGADEVPVAGDLVDVQIESATSTTLKGSGSVNGR
jgi:tRNA-2-methylthio-N6-dimethylallyladenosine synthase